MRCPVLALTGDQEDTWRELPTRSSPSAWAGSGPATRWCPAPGTTSTSRTPTRRWRTSRPSSPRSARDGVVLLHDLGSSGRRGRAVARRGAGGWHVPDLPGHGDAPAPRTAPTTRWAGHPGAVGPGGRGSLVGVAQNAHGALILAAGGGCGAVAIVDGLWGPWQGPEDAIDAMYAGLRASSPTRAPRRAPPSGLDPAPGTGTASAMSAPFAQRFWGAVTVPCWRSRRPRHRPRRPSAPSGSAGSAATTTLVEPDDAAPARRGRASRPGPGAEDGARRAPSAAGGTLARGSGRVDAMAIQKVLGIETEYGIIVRGGDSNPIAASSVLINAYVQELARAGAATGASRVGWDFEDEHPGNDARGLQRRGPDAARGGDAPRQRRPHQRGSLLRRPRPPGAVDARVRRPALGRGLRPSRRAHPPPVDDGRDGPAARGPGDRRLQEQLGPQGQQLRHPRELPDGPDGPVLEDRQLRHAALHHAADLHGRREGGHRGTGPHERRRAVPAHPAGRLLRGGGRPRDDPEAARSSTPATSPTPTPRSTAGCT